MIGSYRVTDRASVRYTGKRDTALRPLAELIDDSSSSLVGNVEKCFAKDDREVVDDDDIEDGVSDGTVGENPTFRPTLLLLSPLVVLNVLDGEENARLVRVKDVFVVGIGGG